MSEEFYGRFVWTDKPGKNRYTFPLKVRFPGWPDDEASGADGTLLIKSGESWAAEVREFAELEGCEAKEIAEVIDTTEFIPDDLDNWHMSPVPPPALTVKYNGEQFYIWTNLCWVNEVKKGEYGAEKATAICIVPFGTKDILDYFKDKGQSEYGGEDIANFPVVNIGDSLIVFTTHKNGGAE